MGSRSSASLPLAARIEAALVVLAWCIEQDGDIHLPLYEKFEDELAALKATDRARDRAMQRLHAFRETMPGDAPARLALPPPVGSQQQSRMS